MTIRGNVFCKVGSHHNMEQMGHVSGEWEYDSKLFYMQILKRKHLVGQFLFCLILFGMIHKLYEKGERGFAQTCHNMKVEKG